MNNDFPIIKYDSLYLEIAIGGILRIISSLKGRVLKIQIIHGL